MAKEDIPIFSKLNNDQKLGVQMVKSKVRKASQNNIYDSNFLKNKIFKKDIKRTHFALALAVIALLAYQIFTLKQLLNEKNQEIARLENQDSLSNNNQEIISKNLSKLLEDNLLTVNENGKLKNENNELRRKLQSMYQDKNMNEHLVPQEETVSSASEQSALGSEVNGELKGELNEVKEENRNLKELLKMANEKISELDAGSKVVNSAYNNTYKKYIPTKNPGVKGYNNALPEPVAEIPQNFANQMPSIPPRPPGGVQNKFQGAPSQQKSSRTPAAANSNSMSQLSKQMNQTMKEVSSLLKETMGMSGTSKVNDNWQDVQAGK